MSLLGHVTELVRSWPRLPKFGIWDYYDSWPVTAAPYVSGAVVIELIEITPTNHFMLRKQDNKSCQETDV